MMRNIHVLLLLLLCNQAYGKDNVRLHGKITNPIADSISVSYMLTSIGYQPNEYAAKLSKDGSFSFEFSVPKGFTSIRIIHGNQQTETFVQPGADLELTLNAKNFDSSVHYEGKRKELANFMAKYELERPMMQTIEVQGQMLCKEEPAEFEAGLKKLEERELDFLQKNGIHLPDGFADHFKTETRYKVYSIMEKYPPFHEMAKQKSMGVKNIPKEDYVVINDLPEAFNDAYIGMQPYRSYLSNYLSAFIGGKMAGLNLPAEMRPSVDSFYALAYNRMPPKSAEYYIGQSIVSNLQHRPIEKTEGAYVIYKKRFPDSKNLKLLEHEIVLKKTFANGKPGIDFGITTLEGKKMKLSDLKGQVVFIDFWASWCAPCIGEMPASKKVRAYFKDKPVSFVYISLDKEDSVWKKAIKNYEVDGINIRLDNAWESETAKKYNVNGVPSYFLVDRNGNFASSDDLARPSETEKLIAQIEKLLK